jgi:hypothetical protein
MGISFKMYDLISADAIAHAVDELSLTYEGACSCPQWLADVYAKAAEIQREMDEAPNH